jgi:hypothetical protein
MQIHYITRLLTSTNVALQVPVMESLLEKLQGAMSGHRSVRSMVKKGGLSDQFGNPGILDDLVDGWAAKLHKSKYGVSLRSTKLPTSCNKTLQGQASILWCAYLGGWGVGVGVGCQHCS